MKMMLMKMTILSVVFLGFTACGGKKDEPPTKTGTGDGATTTQSEASAEGTTGQPAAGTPAAAPGGPAATNTVSYSPLKHDACIKKNLKPEPQMASGTIKIDGQAYDIKKIKDLIKKGLCV